MTYQEMKQACYAQIEYSDKIVDDLDEMMKKTRDSDFWVKCNRLRDRITAFVADIVYPYLIDELDPAYRGQPANASYIECKLHTIEQQISIGFKGDWEMLKRQAK